MSPRGICFLTFSSFFIVYSLLTPERGLKMQYFIDQELQRLKGMHFQCGNFWPLHEGGIWK